MCCDLQAMEQVMAAGIPGQGEFPGASARGCYAEDQYDMNKPDALEGFALVGGLRLHYLDWGGEGNPILFICGLNQNAYGFSHLANRLLNSFRVIALTRRGNGRSDQPEDGYDVQTLTDDIHGFLSVLNIEKAHLIGWSFGGIELTTFAQKYPTFVNKMIYLDAAYDFTKILPAWERDPLSEYDISVPSSAKKSLDSYSSFVLENMISQQIPTEIRDSIRRGIMDEVDILPDGSVVERRRDSTEDKLRKTLSSFDPDYSSIEVPGLAIYARSSEYPDKPVGISDELSKLADTFWVNDIQPFIDTSIEHFRKEYQYGKVIEMQNTIHAIHCHKEAEVYEAIVNFLGDVQ